MRRGSLETTRNGGIIAAGGMLGGVESVERSAPTEDSTNDTPESPHGLKKAWVGITLILTGVIGMALGILWFTAASADRRDEDARIAEAHQLEERLGALRSDTDAQLVDTATLEQQTRVIRASVADVTADASSLDAAISDLESRVRALQVGVWDLYEAVTEVVQIENTIAQSIDTAVTKGNQRRIDEAEAAAARLQSEELADFATAVEAVGSAARRLSLSVAAAGGAFRIAEDFEPPMEGWRAGFSSNGSANTVDGVYAITAVDSGYLMWGLSPFDVTDATIAVTAHPVDGPESGAFSYGVVCRSVQTGYLAGYWFAVDGNGSYQVGRFVPPGDYVDLLARGRQAHAPDPAVLRDVINPGLASNRIEVVCTGSDLSFSVNGHLLWEGSDDGLTGGTVSVAAITYEEVPVTVHFDDLQLTGPGGPEGGEP
jgi:hypothetical protein